MLLIHNHHIVIPHTDDLYLYMPNKITETGCERRANVEYFTLNNTKSVTLTNTPASTFWVELYLDGFRIINHRYPTYGNNHIPFEDYNVYGRKIQFERPLTGNLKVIIDTVSQPYPENNPLEGARGLIIEFMNIQSYDEYTKRFTPARYASGNITTAANVNRVGWYNTALTNRVADSLYAEPVVIHQPHWNSYVRPTSDRKSLLYVPGKNFQGIDCFTYTMITQHGQIGPPRTIYISVFGPQPPERRSLFVDKPIVGEGESFTVTFETESLEWAVPVAYTIQGTGITIADLGLSSLTGNFIPQSTGNATIAQDSFTANTLFDGLPEGTENVLVFLNDYPEVNVTVAITDVTFSLTANVGSIQEGETVAFTLTTEGVPDGRLYAYTMFGTNITSNDIIGNTLTGNFTIAGNSSTVTHTATRDYIREGVEQLTIRLNLYPFISNTVSIIDTHFVITANTEAILRGQSVEFTLTGQGSIEGRVVPFQLRTPVTTLTSSEVGLPNPAEFVIANGTASVVFNTPLEIFRDLGGDFAIELVEDPLIFSPLVNVATRTYSFTSNRHSQDIPGGAVIEGNAIAITLQTTGFLPGSQIPYAITGYSNLNDITANDFVPSLLTIGPDNLDRTNASLAFTSGYFVTAANGNATVTYTTRIDSLFEGGPDAGERFDVELLRRPITPFYNNQIYTVYIRDPAPTFVITPSVFTANEGDNLDFTITTTSLQDNTVLYYNMTGVTRRDWIPLTTANVSTVSHPDSANLSTSVNQLYFAYMGRSATVAELDSAVSSLIANTQTLITLETTISTSGEALAANVGQRTGTVTINNNSGFIDGFIAKDRITDGNKTLVINLITGSQAGPIVSSASVLIIDTSRAPSYQFLANTNSVNEGETVRFTVNTTDVIDYTRLYYQIQTYFQGNITAGDFTDNALVGYVTVINNTGFFDKTLTLDNLTEDPNPDYIGYEVFQIRLFKNPDLTNLIDSTEVYVYDTSRTPGTYLIEPRVFEIGEGNTVVWDITTTNVFNGTKLYWTNSGTTIASDFTSNINSGNVTVQNNQATLSLSVKNDFLTEGPEFININLRINSISGNIVANSAPVRILDTSKNLPTYRVVPDANVKNEGETLYFTVTTTNVDDNTELFYIITGVGETDYVVGTPTSPTDQSPFALTVAAEVNQYYLQYLGRYPDQGGLDYWTGLVVAGALSLEQVEAAIRSNPVGETVSRTQIIGNLRIVSNTANIGGIVVADELTEGVEYLVLTLRSTASNTAPILATANTVRINDTSLSNIIYTIFPNIASVSEGGTIRYTVFANLGYTSTPGVPNGTRLYYSSSGTNITGDDFYPYVPGTTNFSNVGNVIINSGTGSFNITIDRDYTTEGTEELFTYLRNGSTSGEILAVSTGVQIVDSSPTPVITIVPSVSGIDETSNRTVTYTITFDNTIDIGQTLYWDLAGTAALDDFSSRPGGDSFVVPAGRVHTMTFTAATDMTTEGTETIILNIRPVRNGRIIASSSTVVNITDTSQSSFLSVSTNSLTYNEGDVVNITVSGGNFIPNLKLYLSIAAPSDGSSPVSYSDFTDWANAGNPVLDFYSSGVFNYTTTRTIANDLSFGENLEKFRIQAQVIYSLTNNIITGKPSYSVRSSDITINDTSRQPVGNMRLIVSGSNTVNIREGEVGYWDCAADFPAGTTLYWDVAARPGTAGFNATRDLTRTSGFPVVGNNKSFNISSFGIKTVVGVQTSIVGGINQRSFYIRVYDAPGGTLLGVSPFIGILDLA